MRAQSRAFGVGDILTFGEKVHFKFPLAAPPEADRPPLSLDVVGKMVLRVLQRPVPTRYEKTFGGADTDELLRRLPAIFSQDGVTALVFNFVDPQTFGLPRRALGARALFAFGARFFMYPTKLREYEARYLGAFLHGGVSPEDMILPVAVLTPRGGA
jgi:hypothetical protein